MLISMCNKKYIKFYSTCILKVIGFMNATLLSWHLKKKKINSTSIQIATFEKFENSKKF